MIPSAPPVKSKLSFKRSISSEDKERLKLACNTAVVSLQAILRTINGVAGAAVPGLTAGINGLLFVMDVVKKTYDNARDIEDLARHINELMAIIQRSNDNGTLSATILRRIDRLSLTWKTVADEVQKIASRTTIARFIHYSDDAQSINVQIQIITWSIQSFTVETLLAVEFALDEHIHFMRHAAIRHVESIDSGFQQLNARFNVKDGCPPHAIFAQFDYKERDYCLKGTRADILSQIYRWIDFGDAPLPDIESLSITEVDRKGPLIFWINGSAGTGKTTIACTVAKTCRTRNILGASFFCSRDDADCSNPKLLFTTIAHQLGQFCPPFETEVARVLKSKPDIVYSSVPYQLEELIVNPLRTVGKAFPRCIVIVDALDECKDSSTTSIILSSLSRYVSELEPLKILITSRPEPQVTRMFKSRALRSATQRVVLHEIEMGVVQHDIELYLTAQLKRIGSFHGLDNSWPPRGEVLELVLLSFGLFIFAATAARYIEDQNYCDPKHQLTTLLHDPNSVVESPSSPLRRLDELYTQVLLHAFPNISSHLAGCLKMILGTIICLRDPLSPVALEHLLNLTPDTVRATLARLHSVILVPEGDIGVIRLLHPSFFDFMTNPSRCLNAKFVVDARIQHTMLAHACLDVMCSLRRNLCGIEDSCRPNNEISDLPIRIQQRIPSHLQYACRHWSFHLANGMISDGLLELFRKFCLEYLLNWVEACSLLGELRNSLVALDAARKVLEIVCKNSSDIITLLHDCERFIREFFALLSISPLQVYQSALLFTPKRTLLHETYGRNLPLKVYNATDGTWNQCVRTMDGHDGSVMSVAFSPNGKRVISGSHDMTLRLWDTISGAHLNSFRGHSDYVLSVAFSPDGTRIVSGSEDKTVRLWDVSSGAHLITLRGHSDGVESVAISPDGSRVISGSRDRTLRLWDAESGTKIHTFRGHSDWVTSVAFSLDGTRLVSGSRDNVGRLWDVGKGTHLTTLKGHSSWVTAVVFSPSGTRVVSGSDDNTLRVWDAISGAHLSTLRGHSGSVKSVAFSLDSTRIVSAAHDKTLRLWDAISGAHLCTLKGHSYSVESAVFSPDGMYIVSGACDKTLRLWETVSDAQVDNATSDSSHVPTSHDDTLQIWEAISGMRPNMSKEHSNPVRSVTLSPDGTRVASVSHDGSLRLWDTARGTHLSTLRGHSGSVRSVAFSPDGTRVVSGSRDNTLRLWDTVSGAHLRTLRGHTLPVTSVSFSPDGTRVASGSEDKTLRIWDAGSGAHIHTLKGHAHSIESIAFSSDGTRIVSGSHNSLRVWDTIVGAHLRTVTGDSRSAASVARSLKPSSQSRPSQGRDTRASRHSSPYVMEDEWIVLASSRRRLCWIPVSFRPRCMTSNSNYVVIGTYDGRVVFLDLTAMLQQRRIQE